MNLLLEGFGRLRKVYCLGGRVQALGRLSGLELILFPKGSNEFCRGSGV